MVESSCLSVRGFILDFSGEAAVDHLEAKCDDDDAEEDFERANAGPHQDARADEGAGEDAEHHRHGDAGKDVATVEVDSSAGGGGDSDHEVAGGGGDFKWELHDLVHGEDLDGSGAYAEQAGKSAGTEHDGESEGDVLGVVGMVTGARGVGSG